MPTHDGCKYIRETIESCLNQTYENIELIIVDGSPTNSSYAAISEWGDARMIYQHLDDDKGQAHATNVGFQIAKGEYLAWIGDDDLWEPNAIEEMANLLNNNEGIDFVYANYYVIDAENNILETMYMEDPINLRDRNCIGTCFMYRRRVYEKIGDYKPELLFTDDYEYWIRVYKSGFRMGHLNKFLQYKRFHQGSKTGRYGIDRVEEQAVEIRNKYFKGYRLKRFFLSHFDILKGKYVWRKQWLREKHPLIARSLIFLKNERYRTK